MDALRWILLGIGAVFILGIYWWGRSKRSSSERFSQTLVDDVPPVSVKEPDDVWKDGVGPVRIVSSEHTDIPTVSSDNLSPVISSVESEPEVSPVDVPESVMEDAISPAEEQLSEEMAEPVLHDENIEQQAEMSTTDPEPLDNTASDDDMDLSDVIVLYLVAQRGEFIKGEQLLSATYASQLEYGDMNIFHRKDDEQKILFSLADMLDPGSFDIDSMHEHKTRGVSLFIQLSLCDNPVRALDDMFICAHNLSTMLSLQICDQNRQLLNESFAAALRAKARQVRDSRRS